MRLSPDCFASLAAKGMPTDPAALEPAIMQAQPAGAGHYRQRGDDRPSYLHDLNPHFDPFGLPSAHFVASITFIKSV